MHPMLLYLHKAMLRSTNGHASVSNAIKCTTSCPTHEQIVSSTAVHSYHYSYSNAD